MTDKTRKLIAHNLKKARQRRHQTQADLAKKAGISTNYYARIERAEVTPSIDVLEAVVKAVGVKSSDVLPY